MKLHPDLEHLIPKNTEGKYLCPVCHSKFQDKLNWNATLHWVRCNGCSNEVEIFRTAGQELLDDFQMDVELTDPGSWIRVNYDCGKQRFTILSHIIPDQVFVQIELPRWDSFDLEYVKKKVKLYMVLS